ncbi:hypothetical protein A9Q99_17720 [Gammaproteobacteria bacterium 45_16_T64]|nr:hypothetical protein A9Q99_17720 [Gammaproteobacteria bacterium 45_16_T64]
MKPLEELEAFKVIMVDGEDITQALGKNIHTLSLAAVVDEELEPIPFQIDEYNEGGAIYFDGWDVPLLGAAEIFDPQDKLLFLYKDAGSRKTKAQRFDGKPVAELSVQGKDGVVRYVYLMESSRLRSDEQYVRYSSEEALVETDFYSLSYNLDNHINWKDLSISGYEGDDNPIDGLKFRMKTGVVGNLTTINLNNEHIIAQPAGERIGPIRATTQMDVTVWMFGLPMMQISMQVHHYPKSVIYDARIMMPETRRSMMQDSSVGISIDANNLLGATVRTASGPLEAGLVDGSIDEIEKNMVDAGVTEKAGRWIWISTKRNLDILTFFDYLGGTNEPLSLVYADDQDVVDLPERFPGQLPNVGYSIDNFPESGFFGFVFSFFFSNGYDGDPRLFTQQLRVLPDVVVNQI